MEHARIDLVAREAELVELADEMSKLADAERNALGFWPKTAFLEAIGRKSIIALATKNKESTRLVGYLHYSGTFPHAKVQQIAVKKEFRGKGHATALLNSLVSNLEQQGFLSLRADVAEDLQGSLAFYQSNGFHPAFEKSGGKTRNRRIIVHSRPLATDDLFSLADHKTRSLELGLRRRSAGDRPIFAFDLNVYFDLVKERDQSELAYKIFGSALAHELRLAVASEFASELQRTTKDIATDPILQMALRLPKLPPVERQEHESLSDYIHDIVFVRTRLKAAGSVQAISDARHVAHAALARASGFVTRDESLLRARSQLLQSVGIDIISSKELVDLIPDDMGSVSQSIEGDGFEVRKIHQEEAISFLRNSSINLRYVDEIAQSLWVSKEIYAEGVFFGSELVALGVAKVEQEPQRLVRLIIHGLPHKSKVQVFCDYLLDSLLSVASAGKPIAIELVENRGLSTIASIARSKGFLRAQSGDLYEKICIGYPLTTQNWQRAVDDLRRRTGLRLNCKTTQWDNQSQVEFQFRSGLVHSVGLREAEHFLSPTLVILSGRSGVLVPIGQGFADELLGTGSQRSFGFLKNHDAAFSSVKAYVSSPRRASIFRPDAPILFYESMRTGGRGAVVAIARIKDSLVVGKDEMSRSVLSSLVVDDVNDFSSSDNVLVTSFDCLMRVPNPVSLAYLRQISAVDGANLVTAQAVSAEVISDIVEKGWNRS